MTLLILLLLLCIAYLLWRTQFLLQAHRDDLADLRSQLSQLQADLRAAPAARAVAPPAARKEDINHISKNGLRALPRVGAACAQKVIDGRPYASLAQLDGLAGISQAQRESLRQHLAVY